MIACRPEGKVVGGVYMNQTLLTQATFQREAGYVIQADRLLPNLTVKETLVYTSVLKFPEATDKTAIKSRVKHIHIPYHTDQMTMGCLPVICTYFGGSHSYGTGSSTFLCGSGQVTFHP